MKASGRAPAKTAVHKHEKAMHKGKPLTKLAKGGKLNIKAAIGKPGALHAQLGVPQGKKIPAGKLAKAAKAPGKLGQRARFAETLKGFKKGKSKFADGGSVSNFGAAFRKAKKSGADDFTWNGKKYTTDTREDDYKKKLTASTKANQAVGSPQPSQYAKYDTELGKSTAAMRDAGKGITPVKSADDTNYDNELAKSTAAMQAVKMKKGGKVKARGKKKYI